MVSSLDIGINDLFLSLQIFGSTGYHNNYRKIGILRCFKGVIKDAKEMVGRLDAKRKDANGRLLAKLYKERLRENHRI